MNSTLRYFVAFRTSSGGVYYHALNKISSILVDPYTSAHWKVSVNGVTIAEVKNRDVDGYMKAIGDQMCSIRSGEADAFGKKE